MYVATWDARALVTYTVPYDCAQRGWNNGIVDERLGALQPASPGNYRATFEIDSVLPDGCTGPGPGYQCTMATHSPPTGFQFQDLAGVCPSTSSIAVDFALPADGDVNVPIFLVVPSDAARDDSMDAPSDAASSIDGLQDEAD
jgi:hypothetical protein